MKKIIVSAACAAGLFFAGCASAPPAPLPQVITNALNFRPDLVTRPLLTTAEGAKSRELEGQVFVVLGGGQSLKLALVKVSVYPASYFSSYLAWKSANFDALNIVNEAVTTGQWARGTVGSPVPTETVIEVQDTIYRWGGRRWDYLTPTPNTTSTDADGKFRISFNYDGPVVVFARITRSAGTMPETYTWAVRLENEREKETVLLTNENMLKEDGWQLM